MHATHGVFRPQLPDRGCCFVFENVCCAVSFYLLRTIRTIRLRTLLRRRIYRCRQGPRACYPCDAQCGVHAYARSQTGRRGRCRLNGALRFPLSISRRPFPRVLCCRALIWSARSACKYPQRQRPFRRQRGRNRSACLFACLSVCLSICPGRAGLCIYPLVLASPVRRDALSATPTANLPLYAAGARPSLSRLPRYE